MTESVKPGPILSKEEAFFEKNLEERGIKRSTDLQNMFEVTQNGVTYIGPLASVIEIIDGPSSWPAEPMGKGNPHIRNIHG